MTIKQLFKDCLCYSKTLELFIGFNHMQHFSCQQFSPMTPTKLPKHVQFRLTPDASIHVKRPSSFPEFNFKSTCLSGFDLSDELLYKITVALSTEKELISDHMCPWSYELCDKFVYEITAQVCSEESEDKMGTNESPAALH